MYNPPIFRFIILNCYMKFKLINLSPSLTWEGDIYRVSSKISRGTHLIGYCLYAIHYKE